jgi:dipeptidyl aminopeptidase/acylaminoacyl peptidase
MRATPLILIACLYAVGAAARPLALDDLYRWQGVSDPRISPDGNWVAYTVSTPNREDDSDDSAIWLASWDGKQSTRLTPGDALESMPRWSRDGRYLAFLSDRGDADAGAQIWVLDRRTGEARQRAHFGGAISEFSWSPDGKRMVLAAEVPANADDDDKPQPIVIDRLQFKQDFHGDGGYLGNEHSHLYLLDVESGSITQLTDGAYEELDPAWSPEGSQIVFLSKRGAQPDFHDNWDLYLIDARPGSSPRQLTKTPETENDPAWGRGYGPPQFSPDGKWLTYEQGGRPEDFWYGIVQVAIRQTDDKPDDQPARLPTAMLDRHTLDPHWSADGQWVYFILEDDQSQLLARVRASPRENNMRIERLTAPDGVVSEFDVGPMGKVAVIHGTSDRPHELAVLEAGKLRALSHHNDRWIAGVELARSENIEFKSADNTVIHGLLQTPAGARPAAGWPTILRIDGGPVYQWQHEFDFEWQFLVASGYAVVGPNPRGSSGRGFQFQRYIFGNWGFADAPDDLAAVDYLVAKGIADPQRLGVGGWSYGSQQTNFLIATDHRFKAATSGAGISNMLAGYGTDQYVREWESELGLPWEHTDRWLRLSYAFLHADRITTPTLFLGGSEDANVPIIGAEQMYEALRRLNVPTQLVIYPGEYHSFARPSFRADCVRRYVEWYDRYLKSH